MRTASASSAPGTDSTIAATLLSTTRTVGSLPSPGIALNEETLPALPSNAALLSPTSRARTFSMSCALAGSPCVATPATCGAPSNDRRLPDPMSIA